MVRYSLGYSEASAFEVLCVCVYVWGGDLRVSEQEMMGWSEEETGGFPTMWAI